MLFFTHWSKSKNVNNVQENTVIFISHYSGEYFTIYHLVCKTLENIKKYLHALKILTLIISYNPPPIIYILYII